MRRPLLQFTRYVRVVARHSDSRNTFAMVTNWQCKRPYNLLKRFFYSLISTYVVPTLLGMKASGMARAMPCVARQPVQCAGTTTAGLSC